jgi:hypothetical protein
MRSASFWPGACQRYHDAGELELVLQFLNQSPRSCAISGSTMVVGSS